MRRMRPDVVQTWMYHADLLGGVAARLAGIRAIIWSIRHTDLSRSANKRSTLLVAKLCAWLSPLVPRRIVTNAEAAAASHAAYGYATAAMIVIPNGLDIGSFRPDATARARVREEFGLADATPLAGCIGRFDPQKGQALFLQAAEEIAARLPQVRFLMAGRGIERDNAQLWSWIARHGLEDRVLLLGPRDDVARLMAALDILILPSVGEGFPNVVVVAMASGVPCAVTEAGDAAMIVADTGLARPVGDAAGLADAAVTLLSLPARDRAELSMKARARVMENFEIGAVTRRYETLYRAVAEEA
jgi:glycosyltransferase involved in cell wall biosynthesis